MRDIISIIVILSTALLVTDLLYGLGIYLSANTEEGISFIKATAFETCAILSLSGLIGAFLCGILL